MKNIKGKNMRRTLAAALGRSHAAANRWLRQQPGRTFRR